MISSRDTSRVAIYRKTVSPPWQITGAHGRQAQKRAWRPVQNEKIVEKWNKYKRIVILANLTHSLMSPIIVPTNISNFTVMKNRKIGCHFYQKYVYLTESTLQKLMQQNDSSVIFVIISSMLTML